MKRNILYIGIIGYILLFFFLGCTDDYREGEGEGQLYLAVSVEDKLETAISKADPNSLWNPADECKITISSSAGVMQRYEGVKSLPEEIWLVTGNYSVSVTAGDSVPAGFDSPYYKGNQEFTIVSGTVNRTTVDCYLANALVTPYYSDDFKKNMTSVHLVVSNTGGSLTFDFSKEEVSGYYMMSQTAKNLTWTFTGISTDGEIIKKEGTITNAKARTNYKMNFDFDPSYSDGGGVLVGIEVDDRYSGTGEDNIGIIMPPSISGHEFDIDETVIRLQASDEDIKIWINGSSELKSVLFTMDLSVQQAFGLPTNQFDFVAMDGSIKEQFSSIYKFDCKEQTEDRSEEGKNSIWRMLVTIPGEKIAEFDKGYKFSIDVNVEDGNGYTKKKTLMVEIAETPVVTLNIDEGTVWTNRATIQGRILMATDEVIYFQYKKVSDYFYQDINVEIEGNLFTAQLTGLEDGTQYEYRAVAGEQFADPKYFTTEIAAQLPNNSFEDWSTGGLTGSAYLLYKAGDEMFWDSGNHGSTTLGSSYNLTSYDETISNTGSGCAKLESKNVILKFAAGNLFSGEYLRTDIMDGVLSFGRPFTSRPVKLRGWYKYNPATIRYDNSSNLPQEIKEEGAATGNMDKAHIYFAVGDWDAPVEIRTKSSDRKLFSSSDSNIIAYGELIQEEATESDGLIPFEIELDYRSYERKPTYIVIVASASKYGDYFIGGNSILWLDDFELIYE